MSEQRFGEVWRDSNDNEVVAVVVGGFYYDGKPAEFPISVMALVLHASEQSGTNSDQGAVVGRLLSPDHWGRVDA